MIRANFLEGTWWKFKVLFKLLLFREHISQPTTYTSDDVATGLALIWCVQRLPTAAPVVDEMAADWQHFVDDVDAHTHTATQFWFALKTPLVAKRRDNDEMKIVR